MLTKLKIAVLAPMPSASVPMMTIDRTGRRAITRVA